MVLLLLVGPVVGYTSFDIVISKMVIYVKHPLVLTVLSINWFIRLIFVTTLYKNKNKNI